MSVSARVHYAAQAMIELAIRRQDDAPVTIREITDRHGVPGPFLTQILRSLRAAGWVQSIRGAQGGYRLSVDPRDVTLQDIAKLVGGCDSPGICGGDTSASGRRLREVWQQAGAAHDQVLAGRTVAELAEAAGGVECSEAMWFI